MTTIEKLFVQIFERKKSIVDQVKHQADFFDQHLASKCILDGIAPPPWLWSPAFHSQPSGQYDLNKEELISGLLLPRLQPAIPYSTTRLYRNPVVTADGLNAGVHTSSKGFDAGNGSAVLPQCSTSDAECAFNGVGELDFSVASPQHCGDARSSDNQKEPAVSLARIQRSKSRQKALELRNSAKASKSRLCDENGVGGCASRFAGSRISFPQSDHVDESVSVKPVDVCDESCAVEEKVGDRCSKERVESSYSGRITRSRTSGRPPSSLTEHSKLGSSSYIFKEPEGTLVESISRTTQQPNHVKEQGVQRVGSSYTGRITRSRTSGRPPNSLTEHSKLDNSSYIFKEAGSTLVESISRTTQQPNHVNEALEKGSCGVRKAIVGVNQSQEKGRSGYCGSITRSRSSSEPLNNTGSRSTASNKSLLAKSLNRFEGVDLQEAIGAQVNVLPCTESSDNIDLERYDAVVPETDSDSDGLLKARFVSSRSNLDGASLRAGLDDLVSRELPECTMFVNPKQLDFDDVEEYSLDETSSPVLEKKKEGMSSEKKPSTLLHSVDILDKLRTVHYQENCNSSLEIPLPEEQEVLSKDEKAWRGSSGAHVEETDGASRTTNLNAGSSVKETSEVYIDAVTHTSQERNKISKQQLSLIDDSIPAQVAHENSLRIPLKDVVGSNLSNVTRMEFSFEKGFGGLDMVKPTKSVSKDSNLDTDACGGPKISAEADFAVVTGSVPSRHLDITLEDFVIEYPSAVLVDEIKGNSDQHKMNSVCISDDKNAICSKSSECLIANKSIQPGLSFSFDKEGSWPQRKRRKVEGQLTDALSASPSLREEDVVQSNIDKSPVDEMDQNMERHMIGEPECSPKLQVDEEEDVVQSIVDKSPVDEMDQNMERHMIGEPHSSPKLQVDEEEDVVQSNIDKSPIDEMDLNMEHHMIGESESSPKLPVDEEEDVVQSNINKRPVDEMDQNMECRMIGESSPKLQDDEGELCMEEKDRSASTPFTSIYEEPGAPFVSSLVNQATGDSHGCLVEEAEVADPTLTIVDSRRQYALEENQDLENKIELGNTEHLTYSERSIQERKSHLGENGNFSYGSAGSPDRQSMALISADQTIPEFEGFIMQDNEQPCTAGEGINFEKLDLPKSAIERASVLEQLCKSASMHTPLSYFSTTYNRTTNLYQSVPNGLLECMDPRSTLPVNDAFHGRSHSDCLPFSGTQSAWDIRKPYTSPVGKLWDRITSNCGSSEKRGSLNPELPCISEENENPDEVADAFEEEDGPTEMSCSLKREPLADITENPNLSASVSKVEICGGRNSLDSVNTEFSFIGTHNMVKQKLGNHNRSNRTHSKKVKENGMKRASKSVRNRFNKTKLSGKNSLRKEGPSISGQESKRNNIVSNITSFIPLVQQKQAAAIITGKRDVKVKSLEAAEAAKRLQEKKENERKKKKEDLRLERARLEEENQRQLELQKKKKEQEKKKKEADMAVRKRQREEEERKEKEKKRKRVEEARRQQQEHEEKLRARKDEKEMKCRTRDETVHERKISKDETGKHKKMEKDIGDENLGKISEIEPRTSTSEAIKASIVPEDSEAWSGFGDLKVLSNIDKATENENLFINTSQEQSYEISPYKSSDDEDEDEDEEDDIPNTKFKPSWASKNRLAVVVSSQKSVDPETIFPLESFCSIAEVLLPRKHQLR